MELKKIAQTQAYCSATTAAGESGQQGFTLIEVLVAISIFSIGMLALATLQTSSIRHNAMARNIGTADKWAIDRIERLVAISWDDDLDMVSGAPRVQAIQAGDHTETVSDVAGGREYTVSWTVEDNQPIDNCKRVTLTVATGQLTGDRSRDYVFQLRPRI